jgi:hypothetical protein
VVAVGGVSKEGRVAVRRARKARVVATFIDYNAFIYKHFLDGLARIHEDIYGKRARLLSLLVIVLTALLFAFSRTCQDVSSVAERLPANDE